MAREIAQALGREGVQIISGMARGIDSVGQRAALASGGESYAVLGCGVDICYPREAIELYMQLQEQGGIISEFAPQTAPTASHFPARNRIISGMSDAVIVIEAKERSGSLITADMALEQGKDVYALPGPINSRLSAGCNRLIHQGAGIILNTEELLKDLGFISEVRNAKKKQKKLILETTENLVYSSLDLTPKSLDMILNETKMTVSDLLDVLMQLQLRGFIREISKNYYTIVEE
jgi:DNA processing protein